jgi:hypothetical protein
LGWKFAEKKSRGVRVVHPALVPPSSIHPGGLAVVVCELGLIFFYIFAKCAPAEHKNQCC